MTTSGRFKTPIDIEVATESSRDSLNNPVFTWSVWRSIFCQVESRRALETFDAQTQQRYSLVLKRFTCRQLDVDGIDAAYRIILNSQTYDIKNILPDDQDSENCIIEATLQDGAA